MQKVTSFLEKYVEWVAIALGTIFLLYMIYAYALQKPVTVQVGSDQAATPGKVDPIILNGPARALETKMQNLSAPPMPVDDFLVSERVAFAGENAPHVSLIHAWTVGYLDADHMKMQAEQPAEANSGTRVVVALPSVPAPIDLKSSDGRSTVIIPPPTDANGTAQASPPTQANGNNAVDNGVDVNWITIGATLPMSVLAQNFTNSKIPKALTSTACTTLLNVELVREEQDGEGNWGPPKTIPALKNVTLRPLPPQGSRLDEEIPYTTWAEQSISELAQPPFYQVIQGDLWRIPGGKIPKSALAVQAEANFDPTKVTSERGLTPDELKIYRGYLAQKEQARQAKARAAYLAREHGGGNSNAGQAPPGAMPPGGGFGPGGGGPGGPGGSPDRAADNSTPILLAQNYRRGGNPPGMMPGGFPPGMMPGGYPPGMMPGGMPPGMMPGMPGMPQPGAANQAVDAANAALLAAAQATLPKGSFSPESQPDIVIWAHDATAQPGKTYRYQIRYVIRNPVFQTRNLCKPPSLARTYFLTSAFSDWTDAISVKSDKNFFAVNTTPGQDAVKFDIFAWKDGDWQDETVQASPGDLIGSMTGKADKKVNFATGWTLVDVRTDPRNPDNKIILLTTDSGQMLRKSINTDRASAQYKNLQAMVTAAKAKAAATNPAAGGAAGQPNGPPGAFNQTYPQ